MCRERANICNQACLAIVNSWCMVGDELDEALLKVEPIILPVQSSLRNGEVGIEVRLAGGD